MARVYALAAECEEGVEGFGVRLDSDKGSAVCDLSRRSRDSDRNSGLQTASRLVQKQLHMPSDVRHRDSSEYALQT